jgi:hypothetical protein
MIKILLIIMLISFLPAFSDTTKPIIQMHLDIGVLGSMHGLGPQGCFGINFKNILFKLRALKSTEVNYPWSSTDKSPLNKSLELSLIAGKKGLFRSKYLPTGAGYFSCGAGISYLELTRVDKKHQLVGIPFDLLFVFRLKVIGLGFKLIGNLNKIDSNCGLGVVLFLPIIIDP